MRAAPVSARALPRALAVAALLVPLLAGCIDISDPLDSAVVDDVAPGRILAEEALLLESPATEDLLSGSFNVDAESGAAAVFFEYAVTFDDAPSVMPTLLVELVRPDDRRHTLASAYNVVGGVADSRIERSGHLLLPPLPGEWRIEGSGPGHLVVAANVTLLAPVPAPAPVPGSGLDRVVVAVVDTGINPYHEVFERGLRTEDLPARIVEAESGLPAASMPLIRDADYRSSIRFDGGAWAIMPTRTLVHFEGTNTLGYHLDDDVSLPAVPVLDRAGHGTGVAHSVVTENPDVLVVLVTGRDYDSGVEWAAKQPWIDIISLSWGPATNAHGPVSTFRTHAATLEAHRAGKLVFSASGNDPTPTFTDTTSGPPWVHAVAGSQPTTHARSLNSGNFVDTVANWTQELASHTSLEGTRRMSGTSFATPTTAGLASRILHEVRVAAGHEGGIAEGALVRTDDVVLTVTDLRNALNASAVWWSTTQYGGPTDPGPSVPVAPAPWMSMGWGHLDGGAVPHAVAYLLGEEAWPEAPAEAQAWLDGAFMLREEWWGRR